MDRRVILGAAGMAMAAAAPAQETMEARRLGEETRKVAVELVGQIRGALTK